jgi:hypothetical protein
MENKIQLLKDRKSNGLLISASDFELVSNLILSTLTERGNMTLTELVELNPMHVADFAGDFSWLLLQVKRHLEVTGTIMTEMLPGRVQCIYEAKTLKG